MNLTANTFAKMTTDEPYVVIFRTDCPDCGVTDAYSVVTTPKLSTTGEFHPFTGRCEACHRVDDLTGRCEACHRGDDATTPQERHDAQP